MNPTRHIRTVTTAATVAVAAATITAGVAAHAGSSDPKHEILWATVDVDAGIVHGQRVTKVEAGPMTNEVTVYFDRNVTNCSATATTVMPPSTLDPETFAMIRDPRTDGRPTAISVQFDEHDGIGTDAGFHLQVICRDTVSAVVTLEPGVFEDVPAAPRQGG